MLDEIHASLSQLLWKLPPWLQVVAVGTLAVAGSLLFLTIVFRPLELAFPAKQGQRFFRPNWLLDLCFFLGQYLLWNGVVVGLLMIFGGWLQSVVPAGFRTAVAAQVWWLQAIEVIVLSDLFVYWGHRLQHATPLLWRFHAVHHSSEHLDWLAAHREHPIDTIYTMGLINLPVFLLGFPVATIAGLVAFRGIWAIYIHSNSRLPIGPLKWLIGAPQLHHWHHDRDRRAGNYANISPLMDILFGTYKCPDREPEAFGLDGGEKSPRTWIGHMLAPFFPKWKKAQTATVEEHERGDQVREVRAGSVSDGPLPSLKRPESVAYASSSLEGNSSQTRLSAVVE